VAIAAVLLEREYELGRLDETLSDVRQDRGRVVLVEGPAGIGKTSLLRAALDTAAEIGFVGLRARANELERDFAYGCVRQLLEPLIARASDAERRRFFAGAAALSKPLFAPSSGPDISPSAATSFSMLHGLYWLLNNLADESPIALSIDDLHWADAESLRFINYLAPRLDGMPFAVIASVRTGEQPPAGLDRLAGDPDTIVLHPGPLSANGTAAICEHRLDTPVTGDFANACREATGGNPFYLDALLREVKEEEMATDARGAAQVRRMGPAAVAQGVLLRLSGTPAATGALVRAIAVLGDGAAIGEAATLAELDRQQAATAADLLAALGLLTPGEALEFVHPIVREAVYADMGSHERSAAHARAADVLGATDASEERIAAQVAEAEPAGDPKRVELLRRVAGYALAKGAPDAAVALLRRALAEPPPSATRAVVLLELGSAELRAAEREAIDHLATAVEEITDPKSLALSVRLLANALTWARQSDRAIEALDSVISIVEPADRELALFLESDLAAHAQVASWQARRPVARRLERHRSLDGATPGERLVLACLAFEDARASESEAEAVACIERVLAGTELLDEQDLDVPPALYVLLVGLLATDALDFADEVLGRMLADAKARVSIPGIAFVLAHQAVAAARRGALSRAEADARGALELLTTHEIPLGVELALGALITALVEEGEIDAAELALVENGFDGAIPPGMPTNDLLEARARLHLAQGRPNVGLEDLQEYGRRVELWGSANPLASRWRTRASAALLAMGDTHGARAIAHDDVERARRWGAASGIGLALRATALAQNGTASIDRLREAATVLERSPAQLDHARTLVELGAALRRANQRKEARQALGDGLYLADLCGARLLVDHARTELRAAGGRSSDPWGAGAQRLTASERRVAELAAEGLSNPEIAQSLFVTRKTVETHLGRVYQKLAISGRGKLKDALGRESLSQPV
jgi:ATP/maltotriose-dependent transcriptional regulator MalT